MNILRMGSAVALPVLLALPIHATASPVASNHAFGRPQFKQPLIDVAAFRMRQGAAYKLTFLGSLPAYTARRSTNALTLTFSNAACAPRAIALARHSGIFCTASGNAAEIALPLGRQSVRLVPRDTTIDIVVKNVYQGRRYRPAQRLGVNAEFYNFLAMRQAQRLTSQQQQIAARTMHVTHVAPLQRPRIMNGFSPRTTLPNFGKTVSVIGQGPSPFTGAIRTWVYMFAFDRRGVLKMTEVVLAPPALAKQYGFPINTTGVGGTRNGGTTR